LQISRKLNNYNKLIVKIRDKILYFFLGQAHSSVERAGLLGGVKFRQLDVDERYKLRGDTFAEAIRKDKEQGFIPFYVSPVIRYSSIDRTSIISIFFISLKKHKIAEREKENSVYYVNTWANIITFMYKIIFQEI